MAAKSQLGEVSRESLLGFYGYDGSLLANSQLRGNPLGSDFLFVVLFYGDVSIGVELESYSVD